MELVDKKEVKNVRRNSSKELSKRNKLNVLQSIVDVLQLKLTYVTNKTVKKALTKLLNPTLVLSGKNNLAEATEKLNSYISMVKANTLKNISNDSIKNQRVEPLKHEIEAKKPIISIQRESTALKPNRGRGE